MEKTLPIADDSGRIYICSDCSPPRVPVLGGGMAIIPAVENPHVLHFEHESPSFFREIPSNGGSAG